MEYPFEKVIELILVEIGCKATISTQAASLKRGNLILLETMCVLQAIMRIVKVRYRRPKLSIPVSENNFSSK